MNRFLRHLLLASLLSLGSPSGAFDDLTRLSDEFDSPHTLGQWERIHAVEGWGNDVLEHHDINLTRPGHLTLTPHTSSWYQEWRGELMFQAVTGDFVITTEVEPRNRAGSGPPGSDYSLAGIMVRAPRAMTSVAEWTPGGQNYVFLSLGAASHAGTYQYEVKTTVNSDSTLLVADGAPDRSLIQVARIGPHLILLRRTPDGSWVVHQRYHRTDFPATLQAGLTVYTDWPTCGAVGFAFHNQNVLTNGLPLPGGGTLQGCHPDLVAAFDYVRYARPQVPSPLVDAPLSNPAVVSDAELLAFLGEAVNVPGGAAEPPVLIGPGWTPATGFSATLLTTPNRSYRVQWSPDATQWHTLVSLVSASGSHHFVDSDAIHDPRRFYRAVSP